MKLAQKAKGSGGMTAMLFLATLLACGAAGAQDGELPATIRAGTVNSVEFSAEPVTQLILDDLLLANRMQQEADSRGAATETVPPPAGKIYAVLTVRLKEGRSIGKYDYLLTAEGGSQPAKCVAMTIDNAPYDPRTWQYEYEPTPRQIRLLYQVPESWREAMVLELRSAMSLVLEVDTVVRLRLRLPPPPPAPEPAPAPTPAAADAAAAPEQAAPAQAAAPADSNAVPVPEGKPAAGSAKKTPAPAKPGAKKAETNKPDAKKADPKKTDAKKAEPAKMPTDKGETKTEKPASPAKPPAAKPKQPAPQVPDDRW